MEKESRACDNPNSTNWNDWHLTLGDGGVCPICGYIRPNGLVATLAFGVAALDSRVVEKIEISPDFYDSQETIEAVKKWEKEINEDK